MDKKRYSNEELQIICGINEVFYDVKNQYEKLSRNDNLISFTRQLCILRYASYEVVDKLYNILSVRGELVNRIPSSSILKLHYYQLIPKARFFRNCIILLDTEENIAKTFLYIIESLGRMKVTVENIKKTEENLSNEAFHLIIGYDEYLSNITLSTFYDDKFIDLLNGQSDILSNKDVTLLDRMATMDYHIDKVLFKFQFVKKKRS